MEAETKLSPFCRRYFGTYCLQRKARITNWTSLEFASMGPVNNKLILIEIMAWPWRGGAQVIPRYYWALRPLLAKIELICQQLAMPQLSGVEGVASQPLGCRIGWLGAHGVVWLCRGRFVSGNTSRLTAFIRSVNHGPLLPWIPLTKGQLCGLLMSSLMYAWTNGWTNSGVA